MKEATPVARSTEPIDDDELAAVRARIDGASPGPWTAFVGSGIGGPDFIRVGDEDAELDMYIERDGEPASPADLDFIAAARQDIPRLLDEIERLRDGSR